MSLSEQLNFNLFFRAKVLKIDDPLLEGRIGLFIPHILTEIPSDPTTTVKENKFIKETSVKNANTLGISNFVEKNNFIWARPLFLIENGGGGTYKVPSIGSWVIMFFEDGDPQKPRWIMGSSCIEGMSIPGRKIGNQIGTEEALNNFKNKKKRFSLML